MKFCLEVLVFDISDKDFVLHRVSTIENGVEILYTKSYIIIISYVEYWNRTYNKMLPDVLNEITEFFEANKENL